MSRSFTGFLLVLLAIGVGGCSSVPSSKQHVSRVRISGLITNNAIVAGRPLWVTLRVTNISGSDLYVPRHFNSVNCGFVMGGGGFNYHGDDRLPTFEDFVRLAAGKTMEVTTCFPMRRAGEGEFSADSYANLEPSVRQELEKTGIPFIVALEHSFGKIIVQASNEQR